MQYVVIPLVLFICYLVGSIPFGLLIVKLATGKDVRTISSGRTGGTNVMRAAGFLAGAATAILDGGKGLASAWIVAAMFPGSPWMQVFGAIAAIWGSVHSVFLIERDEQGRLHFRGGAGGATTVGGAMALWLPSLLILLPSAALVYIFIGYASITTLSIAVVSMIIMMVRAITLGTPTEFIVYGVLAVGIVVYALRPNFERLRKGNERVVGLRAYWAKKRGEHNRLV
jgi:glycerol-3-phosphate acyltransferase PlsY